MSKTIRISLDTEFHETPDFKQFTSIDLISIGLVDIDAYQWGSPANKAGFYAVSEKFNLAAAREHNFIRDHVLDRLFIDEHEDSQPQSYGEIALGVKEYLLNVIRQNPDADNIEFWAKNGSYDNVLLCRLFGGMNGLYEFMNEQGIKRTHFRDLNELKYPPKWQSPRMPYGDNTRLHNSFYDACYQAATIQWIERNTSIIRGLVNKYVPPLSFDR